MLTLEILRARSLVEDDDGAISLSDSGSRVREQMHLARCDGLNELLTGWAPERHAEIRRMVDELADSFASEMPRPAAAASTGPG